MSRRTRFEIAADILRLGKASRTQIMYSSNLSFRLLDRYLTQLCVQGYLVTSQEGRKTVYRTTEEGKKLMKRIDEVVGLLAS